MLVDPDKRKATEGLTAEQVAKREKEMEVLQRDLKLIEESQETRFSTWFLRVAISPSCSVTRAWFATSASITTTFSGSCRQSSTAPR